MKNSSLPPAMKRLPTPHSLPLTPHAVKGAVLAFDYGEKRTGVAVGDLSVRIAHPLTAIETTHAAQRLDAVTELIEEWRPALLIVGLPSHMNGAEHEMSKRCRKFAQQLEQRFNVRTALVDERLSSHAAGLSLRESGATSTKTRLDQLAAQQILQDYFDELA